MAPPSSFNSFRVHFFRVILLLLGIGGLLTNRRIFQRMHSLIMPLQAEQRRLEGLYGRLRDRLLDLSSRNPLVSYKHRPTSKRQLRFVDAVPDLVYAQLVAEVAAIQILPLTEPDEVPMDERTGDFISHLSTPSWRTRLILPRCTS